MSDVVASEGLGDSLRAALEVVGPRWVLLIVRELLDRGALRFADLRAALPGMSPNTLTYRLRTLEHAGVIERRKLPPPAARWVYCLTERGSGLRPTVEALSDWGRANDETSTSVL